MQQNTEESDYLIIPNPIYDVVFRYLMQDNDSAKIILSTLINEKIKRLDFQPLTFAKKTTATEYNQQLTIKDPVTGKDEKLLHLDFLAVIEKENGDGENAAEIGIGAKNSTNNIMDYSTKLEAFFMYQWKLINPGFFNSENNE